MAFPKDQIAFLYVHRENGEVVFTSTGASRFCPIPSDEFTFDDLVAPGQDTQAFKEQTRWQAPSMNKYELSLVDNHNTPWRAYICEMFIQGGYHGIVFDTTAAAASAGVDYLASILLTKGATARGALLMPAMESRQSAQSVSAKLVEVFEQNLIHFPKHDQWFTSGGKEKFAEQIKFYVSRNLTLQLTLPAFPAKSCNSAKVLGKLPDKGEELAIHSMKIVADLVKKVYPPGLHFNVVSDGHVFSDSVGVDDATVDSYGQIFRKMASSLYPGLITFYGLDDFLFQDDIPMEKTSRMIEDVILEHPVDTALTSRAELARRVLMFLFGSEGSLLRYEIENDSETVGLYSGFKRFMMEDLAQHSTCKTMSKASKKKLCSKVAFLMIQRNRAYSTMVQLLFPITLRISIHPHPNRGPKYGINLIHPSLVAMQRTSNEKLFHTPTPWHNAVLEMADGKFLLMPSASISAGTLVNGETIDGVVVVHSADGRVSHYKQSCKAA